MSRPPKINKEKMFELRKLGKSYREIGLELGCSSSTVFHYFSTKPVDVIKRRQMVINKRRRQHPFIDKFERFIYRKIKGTKYWETDDQAKTSKEKHKRVLYIKFKRFHQDRKTDKHMKAEMKIEEVINKVGENPTCYLTGDSIDISKPATYNFDHIMPTSRGGDNSIDNLGICTRAANWAKSNMTVDEFIYFCRKVVAYHDSKNQNCSNS